MFDVIHIAGSPLAVRMIETVTRILEQFQEKYHIHFMRDKDGLELTLEGISDKFQLVFWGNEITLLAGAWYEHFERPGELQEFLEKLFVGSIQVVVKHRGKTPVAYQLQLVDNGTPKVLSQSGMIFSPFWWKKSYKTLTYIAANKLVE